MEQLTVYDWMLHLQRPSWSIFTDAIKRLVLYSKKTDGEQVEWIYVHYTNLANKYSFGCGLRRTELLIQIAQFISLCITLAVPFDEVYKLCKEKVEEIAYIAEQKKWSENV